MTATSSSSEAWELSAPESLVLRDGPGADRALALKLGLLELVARGSQRIVDVQVRGMFGRERVEKVLVSGHRPLPHTGALAPISTAILNTPRQEFEGGISGQPISAVARTLGSGGTGSRYIGEVVLPALAARGLYMRESSKVLGLFTRTRWYRTSEGERRAAELGDVLDRGQSLTQPGGDRSQAGAYLVTVGAAALLMTDAYRELGSLAQELRRTGQAGDGGAAWVASSAGDTDGGDSPGDAPPVEPTPGPDGFTWGGEASVDLGSIDVGSFDLSAFDGIDSAFDAIDSGVDAGGGADGGGGDGGGGGD